jgi:hypothetical protein
MWTTALLLMLAAQDAATQPPPLRHRPPTDAERASAYPDLATREFVARARTERLRVDSTLNAYRAMSYERLTLGGAWGAVRAPAGASDSSGAGKPWGASAGRGAMGPGALWGSVARRAPQGQRGRGRAALSRMPRGGWHTSQRTSS